MNVFWQAFQNKMINYMLKLYFELWLNVQIKLQFILGHQTLETFVQSLPQRLWLDLKSFTCNWNCFQKLLIREWISYISFPCFQSKSCRQGWELFYSFSREHKLFMSFDNQKQLLTARAITVLSFVTTNWSWKHCTNCSNVFEFFWFFSELLVAIPTTINNVLSLARASLI